MLVGRGDLAKMRKSLKRNNVQVLLSLTEQYKQGRSVWGRLIANGMTMSRGLNGRARWLADRAV
jgi:hypothetical protein